jgi:hypothetical protein
LWESRFDERSIKDDIEDIIGFRYINEKNGLSRALVKLKDGTTTEASYTLTKKNTNITAPTELPSYEGTHPSETENSYFADQLKPSTPRLPIRSPFGDMTPWATILYRLKSAVEKKKSG